MTSPSYFIPVCLYPHTSYRTTGGVHALFEKYTLHAHDHLIVVADRLLALDNLVTGRFWSKESVFEKAHREAEQIFRMIKRVSQKCGAQESGRIVFWNEIGESAEFGKFAQRLHEEFLAERHLARALEEAVSRRVERFGLGAHPDRERVHEQDYLISEVCMSVYCTELLGYATEVWERPPSNNVPDLLKLLYRDRPETVAKATGRPPKRRLEFLFETASDPLLAKA